jgi:hypothetical protein
MQVSNIEITVSNEVVAEFEVKQVEDSGSALCGCYLVTNAPETNSPLPRAFLRPQFPARIHTQIIPQL